MAPRFCPPKHQSNKSIQADGREVLLAPFLAPAVAKTCQNMAISGTIGGLGDFPCSSTENEKTWKSFRKPGFFEG